MATATKTKKAAAKKTGAKRKVAKKAAPKKVVRNRPLLDADGLAAEEARLRKTYKNITVGSLRNRGEREGYGMKRTVEITCAKKDCDNKRIVATSDLHQVKFCESCTAEDRLARKTRARRAAKPK